MKIGIDIGGSHIGIGLVNDNGSIALKIEKFIKDKTNIKDQIEEFITETIIEIGLTNKIDSIGVAIPGTVTENKIIKAVNLGIEDYDLATNLEKILKIPVKLKNDAKCAANAEIGFGNLQDVQDGAVIIVGTGIGGCLVKDHKVIVGKHFSAGEFSGVQTNIEHFGESGWSWASRTGINGLLKRVQEELETDEVFTGRQTFAMALEGNEKVIKAIDRFAREVAIQAFNIHIIFDCEKIAIGGGISAQPLLLELIKKNWDEVLARAPYLYKPEIVVCKFRNDANLIGALYQHLLTYPA